MLGFYSLAPVVVELLFLYLIAATPLFRAADSPPTTARARVETLDGLRGFLALAVFFHHAVIYRAYLLSGQWQAPPRVFALFGQIGVALFFMITGYLFWSQILRANGRPNWIRLYTGRIFRILPLYWFAVGLMLLEVAWKTGWHLRVPLWAYLKETIQWGAGGLAARVAINGYSKTGDLMARVTWTLAYEWKFYASLLVTAFFARSRRMGLLLPPAALLIALVADLFLDPTETASIGVCVTLFLTGMSVACFRSRWPDVRFSAPAYSFGVLAAFGSILAFSPNANQPLPIVLLGVAFFFIASGADLFGVLVTRPAKRLGDVSYGIYLLQGLVLAAAFTVPTLRLAALASPLGQWTVIALSAVGLIALATTAHVLVERTGVSLGRRLLSRSGEAERSQSA